MAARIAELFRDIPWDKWEKILERAQPGVHPSYPGAGKVCLPVRAVLTLLRSHLGLSFDQHHLPGDPFQHGQNWVLFRDKSQ